MLVNDDEYKYVGISESNQKNKSMMTSIKHLIGRIQLAIEIVESHPI